VLEELVNSNIYKIPQKNAINTLIVMQNHLDNVETYVSVKKIMYQ